ncbi:MAG: 5-(carboxyamino)imidazole ribonucleotide synthase [Propionibacteriaceae bacterium]
MQPTIGIIGGGQLAQMMVQEAIGLGLPLALLAESDDVSAARVASGYVVGDYTDRDTVLSFAQGCDVITFDHEHVPPELLREIEALGITVHPSPDALIYAQDKAQMRHRLSELGIPAPHWRCCATPEELAAFGHELGFPIIAKVSRGGYDGHGVWKLDSPAECAQPFAAKSPQAVVIGEEFVAFQRELSVLICRGADGEVMAYPVSQSVQMDGVCVETLTPAPDLDPEQHHELQQLGCQIATELGVVGILAVELLQRRDGSVVINELAMRPHNTGHWSQDGCHTSQFENHLRAVAGLPLGSGTPREPWTVMHNVLGGEHDAFPAALTPVLAQDQQARVHWYGKDYRQGRKLGHVTCTGTDLDEVRQRAERAARLLRGE